MTPESPIPTPTDDADEPARRRVGLLRTTTQAGAVAVSCAAITVAAVAFTGDDDGSLRSLISQGPFGAILLPSPPAPAGGTAGPGHPAVTPDGRRAGEVSGAFAPGAATTRPVGSGGRAGGVPARTPMVVTTVTGGRGIGRPVPTSGSVPGPSGARPVAAVESPVAGAADERVTLLLDDGREGPPEIVLRDGRPGSIGSMTIRVRNTGSSAAPIVLSPGTIVDRPGPLGGLLSSRLLLRVIDADGSVRSTSGLTVAGAIDLGSVPASGARRWRVELEFSDGGPPPSPTTGDNVFQGSGVDALLQIAEGSS